MVDFDAVLRAAQLAGVRQQPLHDLGAVVPDPLGLVIESGLRSMHQVDIAPGRYQRCLSLPLHRDPQDPPAATVGCNGCLVASVHRLDVDAQLVRQRLGQ